MAAYVTSKAAVVGLTKALARDLGPDSINVNSIAPGFTESASVHDNPHQTANTDATVKSRALQRRQVPDDIVGALVFLASPAERFRHRPDDRGGRRLDHAVRYPRSKRS